MAIIHQKDKRSGITYVYESISHWDKEKKQSRAKRTLIGKVHPETGEIVPTDGRNKKAQAKKEAAEKEKNAQRRFYGATYLFDAIGKKIGITEDLQRCFPDTYKQILSIAYYLILEESSPLFRFEKWGLLHKHPYNKDIPSQRSSDLFASIQDAQREQFFSLQGKRRMEKEYWAYDTTSISSYSKKLKQVQQGYNKEHDPLPQINLALLFGEKSHLPFYYRKLAGNIPDVKTVKKLLDDLDIFNLPKVKLVMDRGFYSEENINNLYKEHIKFLIAGKMSLKRMREELDPIYDTFRSFEHLHEKDNHTYMRTVATQWDYTQERPHKGDTLTSKKRMYLHYYFNIQQAAEDEVSFDKKLIGLKRELESGKRIASHEKLYAKYFTVSSTPKRGIQVSVKEEEVRKTKRYFGYFVLVTNETMDAMTALEIYRNKDVVEKAFGNLKERLSMRRTLVSSEESLDGKLFVQFIALIYVSYIKRQMHESGLYNTYTLLKLLDKLDVIECFESPHKTLRVGEVLEKQRHIYVALGVEPPA